MPVISISGGLCCLVKIFTTAVNAVEKERKTQRFALTVAPPMRTGPFMRENGFGDVTVNKNMKFLVKTFYNILLVMILY